MLPSSTLGRSPTVTPPQQQHRNDQPSFSPSLQLSSSPAAGGMPVHIPHMGGGLAIDSSMLGVLMERGVLEALASRTARGAISDQQLEQLQARLHGLHAAGLLSDEELCAAEDLVVECIEVITDTASPPAPATHEAVGRVFKLVAVSERMAVDSSFARQVRKKL